MIEILAKYILVKIYTLYRVADIPYNIYKTPVKIWCQIVGVSRSPGNAVFAPPMGTSMSYNYIFFNVHYIFFCYSQKPWKLYICCNPQYSGASGAAVDL